MIINDIQFNVELHDILIELQTQLHTNGIHLINKINDIGQDIMITCPYHKEGQERRPSAGIRKTDGLFHCFTCSETHSLPEVISYCFGKDDTGMFGWTWLLKNFATIETQERKGIDLDFNRGHTDSRNNNYISEEELSTYRYYHPYMYKRKLTDPIIEMFDIGFDTKTNCITFPVRDINGNCLFVARRSVNYKYFNYPKDVEKPLYGLYELNRYGMSYAVNGRGSVKRAPLFSEIIVCESMLDALTCWVYGRCAVALNGLGTELQFKQLRGLPCRKLILATDNDKAGMEARKRIRANVTNKLITEYILPDNRKDINELSKEEFENLFEIF